MKPDDSFHIFTAPLRNSKKWTTGEVTWSELKAWVDTPSDRKECGNYVLGVMAGDRRTKTSIVSRGVLSLDADTAEADFLLTTQMELPSAFIAHTTFSSAPDAPHWRLLVPLSRSVTPDEYHKLASLVIDRLGSDQFDPGSVQPERYMFMPSAQNPDWFESMVRDGDPLNVDEWLGDYNDDLSSVPLPRPSRSKRDPYEIGGTVGAFNRGYADWDELISVFDLPYEQSTSDRWHLTGARSVAGMGEMSPGLIFSHHVNDPAYGQACSAFDLVRLHRFGHLDEDCDPGIPVNRRPSHEAMLEMASKDQRVVRVLVGGDFDDDMDHSVSKPNQWKTQLQRHQRSGKVLDTIGNWDLVFENEPVFSSIGRNTMSLSVEVTRDLPWRTAEIDPRWDVGDGYALTDHLEREVGIRPTQTRVEGMVLRAAQQNMFHPIQDYLAALPVWDGESRVETCLPGADDTEHNRLVARKVMVAAVARALEPGCKWDHVLVLHGTQGLGKSWWIHRMTRGYEATLGDIRSKDTLLTAHMSWVVVADEGYSLRKAESDTMKEFLTRTTDTFRAPYERSPAVHRRSFSVWSTTNDDTFLRRQEGNRRFLVVRTERRVDFDSITDDYVDQVWAEALHMYRQGETMYLDDVESESTEEAREDFLEEDLVEPLVHEYLATKVPKDWDNMSREDRRMWYASAGEFGGEGTERINRVCSTQIWVEVLGNEYRERNRSDLLRIGNILKQMPGWTGRPDKVWLPGYGPQKVYERTCDDGEEPLL